MVPIASLSLSSKHGKILTPQTTQDDSNSLLAHGGRWAAVHTAAARRSMLNSVPGGRPCTSACPRTYFSFLLSGGAARLSTDAAARAAAPGSAPGMGTRASACASHASGAVQSSG